MERPLAAHRADLTCGMRMMGRNNPPFILVFFVLVFRCMSNRQCSFVRFVFRCMSNRQCSFASEVEIPGLFRAWLFPGEFLFVIARNGVSWSGVRVGCSWQLGRHLLMGLGSQATGASRIPADLGSYSSHK